MLLKRTIGIATVLATATTLAACGGGSSTSSGTGSGSSASGGSGGAGSYGKCDVSSVKAGSIKITPAAAGTLTVETTLPAQGWWNGTTPSSIESGYEYCMAAALAKMAGLKSVTVKNVSFDQLVAGRTNNYDLALAEITITPERAKVVDFSVPYFNSEIGVLVRKGSGVTESNIKSKRCAAYTGTTEVPFLKDELKCSTQRIYPNSQTLYQSVLSGQSDVALLDTAIVLAEAKQTGGKLAVVGQYDAGQTYGAIYPKGSKNEKAFNTGITTLKTSGYLKKMSQDWLGPAFGGDPSSVPVWKIK